jgi:hypothetical protein
MIMPNLATAGGALGWALESWVRAALDMVCVVFLKKKSGRGHWTTEVHKD